MPERHRRKLVSNIENPAFDSQKLLSMHLVKVKPHCGVKATYTCGNSKPESWELVTYCFHVPAKLSQPPEAFQYGGLTLIQSTMIQTLP